MARKTHTEAQMRYDKVNRRPYGFRLHNELDSDIIAKLASVDSMQGYIKQLIRDDIARTCSVPGLSVPKKQMTVKQIISFLETQTGAFDGSMYELLNAITSEYMGN